MKTTLLLLSIFLLAVPTLSWSETKTESATEWESVDQQEPKKTAPNDEDAKLDKKDDPETNVVAPTPGIAADSSSLTSRQLREQNSQNFLVNYSLIDTWIPGKYGVSYAWNISPNGSWEIEYLRGSISVPFIIDDLGKITDQRLTLMYRSFSQRNSFSFLYGVNYSALKFQLGTDYLATISGGNVSAFDIIDIQTLGLTWGMGNRWQINSAIISFDWFVINIPVIVLESEAPFLEASSSEQSKKDVRDVLDVVEKFPTFAIIKFQLGFSF